MTDREIEFVLKLIQKPWKYEMGMNIPVFHIGIDGWKVRIHEVYGYNPSEKYPTHKIPRSQKWNPETLLEVLRALGYKITTYEIQNTKTNENFYATDIKYKGIMQAEIHELTEVNPTPKGNSPEQ